MATPIRPSKGRTAPIQRKAGHPTARCPGRRRRRLHPLDEREVHVTHPSAEAGRAKRPRAALSGSRQHPPAPHRALRSFRGTGRAPGNQRVLRLAAIVAFCTDSPRVRPVALPGGTGTMSRGPLRGRSERRRRGSRGPRRWRRPMRADRGCVPRSAALPPSSTGHGAVARTGFSMARWRSMARPRATTALARLAAFSGERSAYVGSVVNAK